MYLHEQSKDLFEEMIVAVSQMAKVRVDIVEKDYYVTMILQELSKQELPLVFKGGTSLSKTYGVIDRFSEDIDITFTEHIGGSRRKKLKYNVLKPIAEKLGLRIINWDFIESDKDLNQYDFAYDSVINNGNEGIPSFVRIETSLMSYSFPTTERMISNYLYEWLKETQLDLLKKYSLLPFSMGVQSLERTLIDKLFAVCDYYILGRSKKIARHLYDIYKLDEYVNYDENFIRLVGEVREHRLSLGSKIAPSADFNVNIRQLSEEICNTAFYKQDYNDTTVFLISERISYEAVIERYLEVVKKVWK